MTKSPGCRVPIFFTCDNIKFDSCINIWTFKMGCHGNQSECECCWPEVCWQHGTYGAAAHSWLLVSHRSSAPQSFLHFPSRVPWFIHYICHLWSVDQLQSWQNVTSIPSYVLIKIRSLIEASQTTASYSRSSRSSTHNLRSPVTFEYKNECQFQTLAADSVAVMIEMKKKKMFYFHFLFRFTVASLLPMKVACRATIWWLESEY